MAAHLDRRRTAVPVIDELRLLATRLVWWTAPAEVLANETDVLCRVMARGTLPAGRQQWLAAAAALATAPEPVAVVSVRLDR